MATLMPMNAQVGATTPQDPNTQQQLQTLQTQALLQALQQGPGAANQGAGQNPQQQQAQQVNSPWAMAGNLINALTTPNQGSSTTPMQNIMSWLSNPDDWAGGPDSSDADSAGG